MVEILVQGCNKVAWRTTSWAQWMVSQTLISLFPLAPRNAGKGDLPHTCILVHVPREHCVARHDKPISILLLAIMLVSVFQICTSRHGSLLFRQRYPIQNTRHAAIRAAPPPRRESHYIKEAIVRLLLPLCSFSPSLRAPFDSSQMLVKVSSMCTA